MRGEVKMLDAILESVRMPVDKLEKLIAQTADNNGRAWGELWQFLALILKAEYKGKKDEEVENFMMDKLRSMAIDHMTNVKSGKKNSKGGPLTGNDFVALIYQAFKNYMLNAQRDAGKDSDYAQELGRQGGAQQVSHADRLTRSDAKLMIQQIHLEIMKWTQNRKDGENLEKFLLAQFGITVKNGTPKADPHLVFDRKKDRADNTNAGYFWKGNRVEYKLISTKKAAAHAFPGDDGKELRDYYGGIRGQQQKSLFMKRLQRNKILRDLMGIEESANFWDSFLESAGHANAAVGQALKMFEAFLMEAVALSATEED